MDIENQDANRIEWYRSRKWHADNLDHPRCESRGPYKFTGKRFERLHCTLPEDHQGGHLGSDDTGWQGGAVKVRRLEYP
jgi:hypothetical protein